MEEALRISRPSELSSAARVGSRDSMLRSCVYLKTTDSSSATLSLGRNKDLMLLSFSWRIFFLLDWRFLSSQGGIQNLKVIRSVSAFPLQQRGSAFFFPFILLRTSGQEGIQPMDIEAPIASPSTAVKPHSFYTNLSFKLLCLYRLHSLSGYFVEVDCRLSDERKKQKGQVFFCQTIINKAQESVNLY